MGQTPWSARDPLVAPARLKQTRRTLYLGCGMRRLWDRLGNLRPIDNRPACRASHGLDGDDPPEWRIAGECTHRPLGFSGWLHERRTKDRRG